MPAPQAVKKIIVDKIKKEDACLMRGIPTAIAAKVNKNPTISTTA